MDIQVREPDPNHNHWGILLIGDCKADEEWSTPVSRAIALAEKLEWMPFQQGGYHLAWEPCGKRHYLEFWGLSGDEDYRALVESYINELHTQ